MSVADPRVPSSSAGLDGVTTLVRARPGADLAARLAADDALGVLRPSSTATADEEGPRHTVGNGMEVASAEPADPGFFGGIVSTLLGFLFG
jgi:hypothetical protein